MGVKTGNNTAGNKTFSEDVLKIEKCGPEEDYLTVIDVPGIFRNTIPGVTTERDKELVKNMVKDYIRDDRTVILAILPSNVDVTTQEILSLAEEYDGPGERTLGVLTKPDLVTERSGKATVCSLIEGKRKPLNLGYYLVRNRGGDDDGESESSTDHREDLFKEEPWSSLPQDRVGISALRGRLQELLGQTTDRAFPRLRTETRQKLADSEEELAELGHPRQTEREQQQYLAAIAGRFQSMARAALDADYSAHSALGRDELRLITAIVNITDKFNSDFIVSSHARHFQPVNELEIEDNPEDASVASNEDAESDGDSDASSRNTSEGEDEAYEVQVPNPAEFSELERIIVTDFSLEEPQGDVMEWIGDIYRRSRGVELGTFGPSLLSNAFREQSRKWASMTKAYLSKAILIIHRFVLTTLREVCTDQRVNDELMSTLTSDLVTRYSDGMKQAMFLVDVERCKKPYTLNHYFNSNLQTSRSLRITENIRPKAHEETTSLGTKHVVELESVQSAMSHKTNAEQAKEDIHDILEAYYKVARERFVDNVYQQAVDHYLLSGPSSPLLLFSEQWVLRLDKNKLATIAGESRFIRDKRERLRKRIQDLQAAIEILQ